MNLSPISKIWKMPEIICLDKKHKLCGIDNVHLQHTMFAVNKKSQPGSNAYELQIEMVIIDEDDHVLIRFPTTYKDVQHRT